MNPAFAVYRLFANHQIELFETFDEEPLHDDLREYVAPQQEWDRYIVIDLSTGYIKSVHQVEKKLVLEKMLVKQ